MDFGGNPDGWDSIGVFSEPYQAVLEVNGYKIVGLFQYRSESAVFYEKPSGLFGSLGNLGGKSSMYHWRQWMCGVAGLSLERIENCAVAGVNSVGGLVWHKTLGIYRTAMFVRKFKAYYRWAA